MGFLLLVKMTAARTRIWPDKGHYMGLNLGVFLQIMALLRFNFHEGQSDDFSGVFREEVGEDPRSTFNKNKGFPGTEDL
jgi:hypothetical protein